MCYLGPCHCMLGKTEVQSVKSGQILKKSFSFLRNHTRSRSKHRGSRDALQYRLKIGTYCCKNRIFLALAGPSTSGHGTTGRDPEENLENPWVKYLDKICLSQGVPDASPDKNWTKWIYFPFFEGTCSACIAPWLVQWSRLETVYYSVLLGATQH